MTEEWTIDLYFYIYCKHSAKKHNCGVGLKKSSHWRNSVCMEASRGVERNRRINDSAQQAVATACQCINCCLGTFFYECHCEGELYRLSWKSNAVDLWILTGSSPKHRTTLWDFFHLKKHNEDFFFFKETIQTSAFLFKMPHCQNSFPLVLLKGRGPESQLLTIADDIPVKTVLHISLSQTPAYLISSPRISCLEKPQPWALWLLFTLAALMWWAPQAGQSGLTAYHTYTFHWSGWKLCWSQIRISSE